VPAIQGEGRALFAAVTAQGLAGIRARRRSSPYLPGIRSRLWRSIAVAPEGPAGPVATSGGDAMTPGPANGPVLALIRRLPLDLDPD